MAARTSPSPGPLPRGKSARKALDLPILRVESQYRNETRNLQRQERDKYSNFLWNMVRLDRGPRTTIAELVGPNQDEILDMSREAALDQNIGYYQDKRDPAELLQVLKFFSTYLMQQARRESEPEKQKFLLFKAADFARMIVQHSPQAVNADAEALVFGLYVALAGAFGEPLNAYARTEEPVYQLMRRLQKLPQDLTTRLRLGEALVEQTSYFDALVQYYALLRVLARRGEAANKQRGWIVARIGDLFQRLARISASRLKDARKLRAFIDRYNRDLAERGRELPRLGTITTEQVTRVRHALLAEANRWLLQAAAVAGVERRQRLRMVAEAGENLITLQQPERALAALQEHYPQWKGLPETPEILAERSEYLKLLSSAAMQTKRRDVLSWVQQDAGDVSAKLGAIEHEKRERDQRRAALLG